MKVLLTGASSFTGFWFARELKARGHEVIVTMTKDSLEDYEEDRRTERVKILANGFKIATGVEFGTGKFCDLLVENSIDCLCMHGAHSPERQTMRFPLAEALHRNIHNIHLVTEILSTQKIPFVLSGTIFERGEGQGEILESGKKNGTILAGGRLVEASSPYGLCKTLVSDAFEYYSKKLSIPMAKIILPVPFGPYEDRRFTDYLLDLWKKGEHAMVKTPQYVRDNMPIKILAQKYADLVEARVNSGESFIVRRPLGYRESNADFTKRMSTEIKGRTGWACEFKLAKQADFFEPLSRINPEPVLNSETSTIEKEAWNELVAYYRS